MNMCKNKECIYYKENENCEAEEGCGGYYEVDKFDFENFQKEIREWHEMIKEDLKKDKYDMTLLCVDAVLGSVEDIIYDNTLINYEENINE